VFPFFLKDNTVTFSFSNSLFSRWNEFFVSPMISEIAVQEMNISSTSKTLDMSNDPLLPLVAGT